MKRPSIRHILCLLGLIAFTLPDAMAAPVAANAAPAACPTSPNYVIVDCKTSDPNNSGQMFAGALARYGSGWVIAYMKNSTISGKTYNSGYTAQSTDWRLSSDTWGSIARMWKPNGTASRPTVIDPGLHVFGNDVDVSVGPAQIFTSHTTSPGTPDGFPTPPAMVICTGDIDPGCLSSEGNGQVAEVSLRPTDVPDNGTVYAVYSFCPGSDWCTENKAQQIHIRTVPRTISEGHYAPWGGPVTCAKDSGWAHGSGSDNGHHQRAVVVTLKRSGGVGTKMACIYNQYQNGGARTIGMTTSTDGKTWSASTTISKETGFDLHNPYAIWMKGTSGTVRVYYQRYNYDGHCNGLGRNWTLNYIETKDGGATWTRPLGTGCTGIPYPEEITSTSRPIFAQDRIGGHVYCFSTWVWEDATILGLFDSKT